MRCRVLRGCRCAGSFQSWRRSGRSPRDACARPPVRWSAPRCPVRSRALVAPAQTTPIGHRRSRTGILLPAAGYLRPVLAPPQRPHYLWRPGGYLGRAGGGRVVVWSWQERDSPSAGGQLLDRGDQLVATLNRLFTDLAGLTPGGSRTLNQLDGVNSAWPRACSAGAVSLLPARRRAVEGVSAARQSATAHRTGPPSLGHSRYVTALAILRSGLIFVTRRLWPYRANHR